MSDCLFCKIAAGEIPSDKVYEDDQCVVFKDLYPKAPVHLLIVPREHVASLNEMDESHDALMAHQDLDSQTSMAIHFGTFNLGDDGQYQAPELLAEERAKMGLNPDEVWIPDFGEGRDIPALPAATGLATSN